MRPVHPLHIISAAPGERDLPPLQYAAWLSLWALALGLLYLTRRAFDFAAGLAHAAEPPDPVGWASRPGCLK